MYKPINSFNMKDLKEVPQIRLALQGASGTGKTFSALTFPNPVVANFDNGLTAHRGKDITVIPFNDPAFVDTLAKRTLPIGQPRSRPNGRDAFKRWLEAEAPKLEKDQTLIVDSWTSVQDAFDLQQDLEPAYTKTGQLDEFAFWAAKQDFSRDILNYLRNLRCHIVVTFHEMYVTDETGKVLINKVMPLMQGKFVNKLGAYFTDWFRCIMPENTKYVWQTKSDIVSNCKTRMLNAPALIEPNFTSFKY